MSPLRFIRTSEMNAFAPIRWRGRRVLEAFEPLQAFLAAKSNGQLSGLLAEPALASEGSSAARSIAWYTSAEGEIVPLPQASPDQQREAQRWLENALQSASAGSDPDIGPLLQRALIVATLEDILLVGGQVVLINWGLAPPSVVDREDGLRQHFAATLGRYVSLPWLMAKTPGDDRAPDPAPVDVSAPPDRASPVQTTPETASASTPPVIKTASPALESLPAWYQRPWAWALSGALLLICGLLLGLLIRWMAAPLPLPPVANDLLSLQNEVNRSLEEQVARLRNALTGDVCAVESPVPLLPFPAQSPLLPAPGDPAPAPGDRPTPTLAQRLEETTVLVLSPQADGLSMGTGFLVAPGVILSNSHVVGTPAPDRSIFVTGRALGGLQKAQLLNATPLSGSRERLNTPDFALLKLTAGTSGNSPSLPLTVVAEKLNPVVAAGFPGFELQVDPKFAALLDKNEMSAIPELVLSSGEISVMRSEGDAPTIIAHTAIVSQGNSGGPLVDRCGRVVGVNTLIRLDDESRRQGNYALGGNALVAYLRQHQIPVRVAENPCTTTTP